MTVNKFVPREPLRIAKHTTKLSRWHHSQKQTGGLPSLGGSRSRRGPSELKHYFAHQIITFFF